MDSESAEKLKGVNLDMAIAETGGDKEFFDALLAPTFAFLRANGAFDDRQIFLAGLRKGARRECDEASVRVIGLGEVRALVTCVVRMEVKKDEWQAFDNARLFVRDATGSWRLLAWANEPAPK